MFTFFRNAMLLLLTCVATMGCDRKAGNPKISDGDRARLKAREIMDQINGISNQYKASTQPGNNDVLVAQIRSKVEEFEQLVRGPGGGEIDPGMVAEMKSIRSRLDTLSKLDSLDPANVPATTGPATGRAPIDWDRVLRHLPATKSANPS